MNVSNQRPQTLVFDYAPDPASDPFDPVADARRVLVDPLFAPANPTYAVAITDDAGDDIDADAVLAMTCDAADENVDPAAEAFLSELYRRTLEHYTSATYPANRVFVTQAASRLQMPFPSARCIYTAGEDVVPAAKALVKAPSDDARNQLFCTLAFCYEPDTTGVAFMSNRDFQVYQTYVVSYIAMRVADPNDPANRLASDFMKKISLDNGNLIDSLMLRRAQDEENGPLTFARLVMAATLDFARRNPDTCFMLPFTTKQCFAPEHLVFVNVDAHAHALPNQVAGVWDDVVSSISNPLRVISNKRVMRLTAQSAIRQKAVAQAANAQSNRAADIGRFNGVGLSKTAPKPADIARFVSKLMMRLGWVNRSQNAYKKPHRTFMRPSRRHPDDPNVPGVGNITAYKPDIHLYVDTSGSISEDDYASTCKALIALARKLDVNLYFTSFSHVMSETSLIKSQGCSAAQMWRQVQKLPKVTGGTDYEQIWRYVMDKPKRQQELSLVITDFEYTPPSRRVEHPKNLYYAPCTSMSYGRIQANAETFIRAMTHIEPAIRARLLF